MKSILISIALTLVTVMAAAQPNDGKMKFTEASELTLTGNLMPDTPNPYHRVDTVRFKGFTESENAQVRMSAGIAVAFRTDSKKIEVKTVFTNPVLTNNSGGIATRGYDLYIRKDGKWLWAGDATAPTDPEKTCTVVDHMDGTMHECLLYLPIMSEVKSVKIGTDEGAVIEAIDNPFRHRIGVFGSSYTHGVSTMRGGMAYPCQLSRMTGLDFLSLGCNGNCKMQPYFADVLCAADVDAFLFDAFSNPDSQMMRERLFPFIEKIQAAHPGKPLIFQKTIYREYRNFNTYREEFEADKMATADSLMKIAVKKYDDVYYVTTTNAGDGSGETSADGTHPNDYGYTIWAKSVEKPILKILKKYGIK